MSPADDRPKSLARSLGEFFGHIARGVRTDPSDRSNRREVRREVEEVEREDGVVLRRTTIEEVELPASRQPPTDAEKSD